MTPSIDPTCEKAVRDVPQDAGAPVIAWTPEFIAALAFLALVGSAGTTLIWFSELQHTSLITLGAWTLLTPVFGVAFGWLLLDDRLTGQQTIGIGLVLAALPIILLPRFRHPSGSPRPCTDVATAPASARSAQRHPTRPHEKKVHHD